jgi:hypothetical protein
MRTGGVHELFCHPSFASLWSTVLQSLQDGDPRQPGTGVSSLTYTAQAGAWDSAAPQTLLIWHGQPAGPGDGSDGHAANVFATALGGTAGPHGTGHDYSLYNQSVGMKAALDWMNAANPPPPPPPPPTATFVVHPTRIPPNVSTPRVLFFAGAGTTWSGASVVSITNSVSGTTTVTAGTWTAVSTTFATLEVTTGGGTGTFTITVDGVTSPILVVAPRRKGWFGGMSRVRLAS